jgi:hypothetical protein
MKKMVLIMALLACALSAYAQEPIRIGIAPPLFGTHHL